MVSSLQRFAELGQLFRQTRVSFAEAIAVTDPEVLRDLLRLLEPETGDLRRVYDVTLDDSDTFTGRAEQRIALGRSQTFQFTIGPERMVYRLVDGDAAAEFAESDEGFVAIAEFSSRAGKKLNCKPGNMQCGGKCQSGKKNCFANMTPAQRKVAKAAAAKARATGQPDSTNQNPSSNRSQRLQNLADAIDKADIAKVVNLADELAGDATNVRLNENERDRTLKLLRSEAGYDALPKVGTAQEVTDAWKQGGVLMFRGDIDSWSKDKEEIFEQFQAGSFHAGRGIYGNGTYVAHSGKIVNGQYVGYDAATEQADERRSLKTLVSNGYMHEDSINTRMALSNPVVALQSQLVAERNQLSSQIDQWANLERQQLSGNELRSFDERVKRVRETLGLTDNDERGSVERLAILRGIDTIALDESNVPDVYMNLLNRSKVIVQRDPLGWNEVELIVE